jgi:ferritin
MITEEMSEALSRQINAEFYSAYLYMSMASYSNAMSLKGAANWFYIQAQEEMAHTKKMYDYIESQGSRPALYAIDQPPSDFKSLLHAFEETLAHEKMVTGRIADLANLAHDEKDHATQIFLQWFVTEQVEEEETAQGIVDRLKLAGDSGPGLFMVDGELAARVLTVPAGAE